MRFLPAFLFFVGFLCSCEMLVKNEPVAPPAAPSTAINTVLADSSQFTEIEWKEKSLNFGTITEGQKLEVVYHFKNTGNKPLVISKVTPGCGCTVAETPAAPIAPGEEGVIKGAFDSNGRLGTQHKSISVYANTRGLQNHELVFEVDVKPKS